MIMKAALCRFFALMFLCSMLFLPSDTFAGAQKGLILWSLTVIPTLLPFMLCSQVLIHVGAVPLIAAPLHRIAGKRLNLSESGIYALITGFLCGYPMGAKTCADFVTDGEMSGQEASVLLAICNHPSPMFLLGYTKMALGNAISVPRLLLCIYLPVLPLFLLSQRKYQHRMQVSCFHVCQPAKTSSSFEDRIAGVCETIIKIGLFIMLFSILAAYTARLTILSAPVRALLLAVLEITTGIPALASIFSGDAAAVTVLACVAFGGICGIFQTYSVIKSARLSIRHYIIWKLLHAVFAVMVFSLLQASLPLQ